MRFDVFGFGVALGWSFLGLVALWLDSCWHAPASTFSLMCANVRFLARVLSLCHLSVQLFPGLPLHWHLSSFVFMVVAVLRRGLEV